MGLRNKHFLGSAMFRIANNRVSGSIQSPLTQSCVELEITDLVIYPTE